jgi:mannose-6-phosphate isomerase-like protein (cupin superfamily)
MHVVSNPPLTPTPMPGVEHATLAGSAQGLSGLSLWSQTLAPGAATPLHRHDCDEVVLCLAGRGEVMLPGRKMFFGANQTLCLPRDVMHQIVNNGSEPLRLLAAFGASPVGVYLPDGAAVSLPWPT